MDIACPNCAATYRVPDALIDGVNAVRCVACSHTWVPDAPAAQTGPIEVAAEVAEPELEPQPAPEPPPWPAAPEDASPAPEEPPPEASPPAPAASPPPEVPSRLAPMTSDTSLSLTATRVGPPGLAPRRRSEGARPRRVFRPVLSAAWAVSIALVIGVLFGLVIYRAEIMAAWPPFGRLAG